MTRKHYEAMAKTIRYHVEGYEPVEPARIAIDRLVRDICHDLKVENRNFNRDRFIEACGLLA
jgi:hypothetical protein